ncbi:DNA-3-methyladenine glycosylase [Tenuifilum thalassicum]|uniref:Putative 3-methyladenine DNA glycosylase n=1 Tax=Tenuifilum thalassicum TaxID=2590900 RepID=A0A7D3Y2Q7_9BACT|nr:DNA-3-methyladenine glycosylase [Tenuifilum thalassicum]QKG78969.1 DNA-3-methyladenine glycosylase [Tenuifilum thalassicum]
MRLQEDFYLRDVLEVAPNLLGKTLVRQFDNGKCLRVAITEVEAYRGTDDLGCHASKGKTERNKVMFEHGGLVYVYLIYGMYWMFNVVTGKKDDPQAVLIRGITGADGPGKLTKLLSIDKSFYGENLVTSKRIWIEDNNTKPRYITTPRIGIDYAGPYWSKIPWRFIIDEEMR